MIFIYFSLFWSKKWTEVRLLSDVTVKLNTVVIHAADWTSQWRIQGAPGRVPPPHTHTHMWRDRQPKTQLIRPRCTKLHPAPSRRHHPLLLARSWSTKRAHCPTPPRSPDGRDDAAPHPKPYRKERLRLDSTSRRRKGRPLTEWHFVEVHLMLFFLPFWRSPFFLML